MDGQLFVCLNHNATRVVLQVTKGVEVTMMLSRSEAETTGRLLLKMAADTKDKTAPVISCEFCGKPTDSGWRYCSARCRRNLITQLERDGYLHPVPRHIPKGPDKPGSRHCGEGSGSWDNAVKAVEAAQGE